MADNEDVTPEESTPEESLAVNKAYGQSPMAIPPSASSPATIIDSSQTPWNAFPDANPQEIAEAQNPGLGGLAQATGVGLVKGAIPLGGALLQKVGYTPEQLQSLQTAYPVATGAGEVAGFVAPAIASLGGSAAIKGAAELTLPGLIGKIGQGVAKIPGVSKFAASGVVPKMLTTGVTGGLEMTALQANNEISDLINKDPDQAVDYAKIGSRLKDSALFGLAFGTGLGTVSGLWNKASNIIGSEKIANDFMGETKAIQDLGDPLENATKEVNGRLEETNAILNSGLKDKVIDQLTQDVSPENVQKHIDSVSEFIENAPPSLKKDSDFQDAVSKWKQSVGISENPKTLEPLSEPVERQEVQESLPNVNKPTIGRNDLGRFYRRSALDVPPEVTTIQGEQPSLFGSNNLAPVTPQNASRVFKATENFKRQLQEFAQPVYNGQNIPISSRYFTNDSASLASTVRQSLEDSSIWGKAGDVQKEVNAANSQLFKAQKDFLPKVTGKEMGERVADSTKVQTLLNQTGQGKVNLRTNAVKNYLEATQKSADAINKVHLDNGLEAPFESKLNSTPVLDHALNTPPTPGVKLARWVHAKGGEALGKAISEGGAGAIGAGLGSLAGQPLLGAWASEKVLAPIFSNFAKPFAENAMNSTAAKATIDYLGNIVRGKNIVAEATNKFFKPGVEILNTKQIPNDETREKVEKNIGGLNDDSDAMWAAGSNISHYLPSHGTAIAQQTAQGLNYLNSLKPKPIQMAALDAMVHPGKTQSIQYNRALDIAHEPLIVLHKAKEGTLLPSDLQALDNIHPGMRRAFISNLTNGLIEHQAAGGTLPYRQRASLNLIMGGAPIDSTFSPMGMQSIMRSASPPAQPQSGGRGAKGTHPSSAALNQMSKTASLYATPDQSRQIERRS